MKTHECRIRGQRIGVWYQKHSVFCLKSVCGLSSIDQPHLSGLWLHAGEQSLWRAEEVECFGQDAILEAVGYRSIF